MQDRIEETQEEIPLSKLRPGQQGTIIHVGGNKAVRRRYLEMGFVHGETVFVRKKAPLGDPVQYQVKGYNISIRVADAEKILVFPENGNLDG
jgi:Fe2+ transport system protein FeoA